MIFSGNAVTINKKRRISARLLTALAAIALLLGLVSATFADNTAPDVTADKVWGQGTAGNNFAKGLYNNGHTTAYGMYTPTGVAVDSSGVYVVDRYNNRVLFFPTTGGVTANTATRVYGQGAAGNDFISNVINNDGTNTGVDAVVGSASATSMKRPTGGSGSLGR